MCVMPFLKKSMRRVAAVAVLTGILFSLPLSIRAGDISPAEGMNWYCAHAKGHVQPRADSCFDFVESCGGYYIDHRHSDANAEDKVIYLTFDVGYENGNVARILDILRDENVTGAFFVLGHVAEKNPELLRRMTDEGHLVCNHTFTHQALIGAPTEAISAELGRLENACLANAGVTMAKYFRPPEGRFDRAMLESAQALGYKTVFWSFAYADWDNHRQPNPKWAKEKILANVHNGEVMLLHPTSETNVLVLGDVLRTLRSQGYRFGTLDELTAAQSSAAYPSPFRTSDAEQESCTEAEQESETAQKDPLICHGRDNSRMEIALSFDDGPHPRYTPMILEILEEYAIKATFFMVGENVKYYPSAAESVAAAGHEIGNHTYTHRKFNLMNEHDMQREIEACEDAITSLSEQKPQFIRPPEGNLNDTMRRVIGSLDYRIVLWDVDTRDWAHTPPESITKHILDTVKSGDIILMHDFIGHDSPTPEALRMVIPALLERGYHFVTVGELVDGVE